MKTLGLGDLGFLGAVGGTAYDADAAAYIAAVEAADGQALEAAVKDAIDAFIRGCKADGIWSAIKASCILAGARTLAGALVPLVGTAPTKQGTEGGWSYNRKTGLKGNGTNNYLDSGYVLTTANHHLAAYKTEHPTLELYSATALGVYQSGYSYISTINSSSNPFTFSLGPQEFTATSVITPEFLSHSYSGSSYMASSGSSNFSSTFTANTISSSRNLFVSGLNYGGSPRNYSNQRIAFYSAGQALAIYILRGRVTDLINALSTAIP